MHGARPQASVKRGAEHPNYVHGQCTQQVRAERRARSIELHRLLDLGIANTVFDGKVRLRGRKPNG